MQKGMAMNEWILEGRLDTRGKNRPEASPEWIDSMLCKIYLQNLAFKDTFWNI